MRFNEPKSFEVNGIIDAVKNYGTKTEQLLFSALERNSLTTIEFIRQNDLFLSSHHFQIMY